MGRPFSPFTTSPRKETAVALEVVSQRLDRFEGAIALYETAYKMSMIAEQHVFGEEDTDSSFSLSLKQLRKREKHRLAPEDQYARHFTPDQLQRWQEFHTWASQQTGMNLWNLVSTDENLRHYGFRAAYAADKLGMLTSCDLRETATEQLKARNLPTSAVTATHQYIDLLSMFSTSDRPLRPDLTFAQVKQAF